MNRHHLRVFAVCFGVSASSAQQWVPIDRAPAPRNGHGLVTDTVRNRVVMFGGGAREDTWVFDGSSWNQVLTATPVPRRMDFATAFDAARGNVVVFGGRDPWVLSATPTETWLFDSTLWSQVQTTPAPPPRWSAAMAFDAARGETVLFGGYDSLLGVFRNDTWGWNGTHWTLRTPAVSPPPLYSPVMAYDVARQRIVLFDTWDPTTWEWDGIVWSQIVTPNLPPARREAPLVYRPDLQCVQLFGGSQGRNQPLLADTWSYDGTNWTSSPASGSPPSRFGHGLAWDPVSSRAITFSGRSSPGVEQWHGDTWALSSTAWTQIPMPSEPRSVQGMTYDSLRDRIVALTGNSVVPQTWEYDGTWQVIPSVQMPWFVWHQPLVFDSWRGVTVTYTAGYELATWEWGGAGWQRRTTSHTPAQRVGHALGFDPVRGVVVLFGGQLFIPFNDTWEYDGVDWIQRTPINSPPVLRRASMAFHAASNRLVLFGGELQNAGPPTNDTWEYDGITWTLRQPVTRPPIRAGAALVVDPTTGDLILAGGSGYYSASQPSPRDTWRWDGTNWHATSPQGIYAVPWQSAAADPHNAMMADGERWWRWTSQPAHIAPPSGNGCGHLAPRLGIGNRPYLGNDLFRVYVEPTAQGAPFIIFAGLLPAATYLGGGCTRYVALPLPLDLGCASPTGIGRADLPIPRIAALRGVTLHFQALVLQQGGALFGFANLTDRRTLVLGD